MTRISAHRGARGILACAVLWLAPLAMANADVTIDASTYLLISTSRADRDHFDFTYTAAAANSAVTVVSDCVAQATSSSPNTQVRDGMLSFPPLPAGGSQVSTDTFTIRQHRLFTFDPSDLSWEIECAVPANARPIANAGAHQSVLAGSTVTLDGSGSSDPEGSPVTFSWSFLFKPENSAATLSDPAAVTPTFVADVEGVYDIRLVVHDGVRDSAPDYVMVATETENTPPVADAGPDQNVFVNDVVQLDGTGSTDVNGGTLAFDWDLVSRPSGSNAVLVGEDTSQPTFVADAVGDYRLRLIVGDEPGATDIDEVVISSAQRNRAPIAMAGTDQVTNPGVVSMLDGTGSFDPDGTAVATYTWSLTSRPAGSNAVLAGAMTPTPSLQTDRAGEYVVQLIVSDGTLSSETDTVLITTNNAAPIAQAGPNQTAVVGATVHLQGSGTDANNDPLAFSWSLTTRPVGSTATLTGPFAPTTGFVPDLPGLYTAQLIVSDGTIDSAPDTLNITATQSNSIILPATISAGLAGSMLVPITITRDPATTGTVVLELTSSNSSVFTVLDPAVTFPAGQNSASVRIRGQALGTAELRALGMAPASFPLATSSVSVSARVNILFANMGLSRTDVGRTFTISYESPVGSLAPAPAGGTPITLTAADPGCVSIPATVTIPAGQTAVAAGIAYGGTTSLTCTTTVTAIGPAGFSADSMTVTVSSVGVGIAESSVVMSHLDTGQTIGIRYESPMGTARMAPAPVPFTLSAADAACVSVTSPGTIASPTLTLRVPISYGGSAPLPCTTTVTVTGPAGYESDSVTITVNAPQLSMPQLGLLGAGLQSSQFTLTLPRSDHPGVTVHFASADPASVRIAPNQTTPGSGTLDVFVPSGSNSATFVIQGGDWVPGQSAAGEVVVTATAPGFASASRPVLFRQSGAMLDLLQAPGLPATPYTAARTYAVTAGVLNLAGAMTSQHVRAGSTLTATISSSSAMIAALEPWNGGGGRLQTLSVDIPGGPSGSSISTFHVHTLSVGTAVLTATVPNGLTTSAGSVEIEVVSGGLDGANPVRVGAGLQRATDVTLASSAHNGVTIHVESNDPRILLAPITGYIVPGTSSIDVQVPAGQRTVPFIVQAVDWTQGGSAPATVSITASGPGMPATPFMLEYVQSAVRMRPLQATTIQSPNLSITLEVGIEDGSEFREQRVRWGGQDLIATVTSSDLTVAQIEEVGGGPLGTIAISQDRSTPRRGVELDAVGVGAATITASIPGFITLPAGIRQVTVTDDGTQAQLSLPPLTVLGGGLQTNVLTFDIPHRNHAGMTVTITSSDANRVRVAPNYTTAGTTLPLTVQVPAGATRVDFVLQGRAWNLGSSSATVNITASATTSVFAQAASRSVSYRQATIGLPLPDEMHVSDANLDLTAALGVFSLSPFEFTAQRAGPAGVVVTLESNFPNRAELDPNGGGPGAGSVVRTIPAGQASIPFDAPGGVELDPLTVGVTAISASAPGFRDTDASGQNVDIVP
jgi:hypothetical protein